MNRKWYQFELNEQFAGCYLFSESMLKHVLFLNPKANVTRIFEDIWDMRFEMVNENLKTTKTMLDGV